MTLTKLLQNNERIKKMQKYNTSGSKKLYEDTCSYLVDGVSSSFHKAAVEEYPICMNYAKGSKMYDVEMCIRDRV